EGHAAIDDDGLSVISKIELKAIRLSLARIEWGRLDSGIAELAQVGIGQVRAAHLVEEHIAAHAFARLGDECVFQPPSQTVVVDDIKLHQYVLPRLGNTREDRIESRLPVDQQLRV